MAKIDKVDERHDKLLIAFGKVDGAGELAEAGFECVYVYSDAMLSIGRK